MNTTITINEKTKLIIIHEFDLRANFSNFRPNPFVDYIFRDPKYKILKDNSIHIEGYQSLYKLFLEECDEYTPENTPFETLPVVRKKWFSKKLKYYYPPMSVLEYKEKTFTVCTFKGFALKILHNL